MAFLIKRTDRYPHQGGNSKRDTLEVSRINAEFVSHHEGYADEANHKPRPLSAGHALTKVGARGNGGKQGL